MIAVTAINATSFGAIISDYLSTQTNTRITRSSRKQKKVVRNDGDEDEDEDGTSMRLSAAGSKRTRASSKLRQASTGSDRLELGQGLQRLHRRI